MGELTKYEPRDITEAIDVAPRLVGSRLLPKGIATPEAALAIIMTGCELGLGTMASLRSIHIVEGKPTLSADAILAVIVSRREVCKYFRLVESTASVARYETLREGHPSPTAMSFTIDEAKTAGLLGKDNWRKYPAAMLRARCIAALGRAVYPDLVLGVYESEELAPEPPRHVEVEQLPAREEVPRGSGPSEFAYLASEVAKASTLAKLDEIAGLIKGARDRGTITGDERGRLATAYSARRKAIAPKPVADADVSEDEVPAAPTSDMTMADEEHAAAIDRGAA